jgi:peptidoglycan/xylan/chitin deacetylase (PgdA/CDA1 family)
MEFQATSRVEDGKLIVEISAPEANEYTRYAYYLYSREKGILQKQGYIQEPTFAFPLSETGNYYAKAYVKSRGKAEDEEQKTSKNTNVVPFVVPFDVKRAIPYECLDQEDFRLEGPTIYEILWDGVKFELLINYKPDSSQAVVCGTGDVVNAKQLPTFSRATWADEMPGSGIWYFDPSVYLGEAKLCWGYGTNDRWYLENIACLVKRILDKWGVTMENALFFGSSAGGYMSIALATLLRGKATVLNPQLNMVNDPPHTEQMKNDCLKAGEELLEERTNAVKLFRREGYVPRIHIVQNSWAERDMETQIAPFLLELAKEKVDCTDRIDLDLYSAAGGHAGMPSKEESIQLMREDLTRPLPEGNGMDAQPAGGQTFLDRLAAGTPESAREGQPTWTPENDKKLYLMITIDTEDKVEGVPRRIEGDFGPDGNCGVNYIMEQLEKRGMRGVFFVNVYEHPNYQGEYEGYMEGLVRRIADRGHEVALHTHSNRKRLDFFRDDIDQCGYEEQFKIIEYGTNFIEKHTGKRPVSFRGGGYHCTQETFRVLSELGYRIDSTCNYSSRYKPSNRFRNFNSINSVCEIGDGVLEFPVVTVLDSRGRMRKYDLMFLDLKDMITVTEVMRDRPQFNVAQLMFHSFSFIQNKDDSGKLEPLYEAGTFKAYGINRGLQADFERFLDFVQADPNIEVVTFEQLLERKIPVTLSWGDGIIRTDSEKAKEAEANFRAEQVNDYYTDGVEMGEGSLDLLRQNLTKIELPRPQEYFSPQSAYLEAADELLNGKLMVIRQIEPMDYDLETLDWNTRFSRIPNSFQLYLQALNPVRILTEGYQLTGDGKYLEHAYRFIRSWWNYASDESKCGENHYAWGDHSVALRTENLLYFLQTCAKQGIWFEEMQTFLYDRLCKHGELLYDNERYSWKHNHGVMQDQALLHLAFMLGRKDWIGRAEERLLEQEAWAFNPEMVHTENSAGYARMVATMFRGIGSFLAENQDSIGEKLISDMEMTQHFLDWTMKPNGIVAQIGDTGNTPGKLHSSRDNMRRKTEDTHCIYPLAGYYFYRSQQDQDEKLDTWKMLKSGYVQTTHKHADDCSFMLYSKGYEIFADCGIYGYVKDEFRAYFLSAKAHNTVVVDDESWICSMARQKLVGMSGHQFCPDYDRIQVFNNAYRGVEFRRDFCSSDDLTILLDTLTSQKEHTYSQLFHLSEQMEVLEATDHQVLLKLADSGYVVRLRQLGGPVKLSVLRGDRKVPGYGLISRGANHLDVTTTLKFDMTGKDAVFATAITIEDGKGMVRTLRGAQPADALRYDAESKRFTLGELEIPCGQELPGSASPEPLQEAR